MKERGAAHIFLILFLLAGLALAVYLVQQKTHIFPKAQESSVSPASILNCSARLGSLSFSVDNYCDRVPNGYKSANYSCLITIGIGANPINKAPQRISIQEGIEETCKSVEDWENEAINNCRIWYCSKNGVVTPGPKPKFE